MKKSLLILATLTLMLLAMGFTQPELTQMLKDKTQEIIQLRSRIFVLEGQVAQLQESRRSDKTILLVVDYLTEGATPSRWANPEHVAYVIAVCKKYEYLVADIKSKEKLACWQFVLCRCLATGLNPNFRCDNDRNGKFDNGLADLNDVCLDAIQKELPEHLRKSPWTNIEKSVAGLYIWIKQRNRKAPWAELSYSQWRVYAAIKD